MTIPNETLIAELDARADSKDALARSLLAHASGPTDDGNGNVHERFRRAQQLHEQASVIRGAIEMIRHPDPEAP